jgi:hypothetical protein
MADWSESFKLEMKIAQIISEQGRHGCNFKSRDASWHTFSLKSKIVDIDIDPFMQRINSTALS